MEGGRKEKERERRGRAGEGARGGGGADVLRNSQTIQPVISWDEVKGIPNHCLMTGNTVRTPKALALPATRALLAILALQQAWIPAGRSHGTESDGDYTLMMMLVVKNPNDLRNDHENYISDG